MNNEKYFDIREYFKRVGISGIWDTDKETDNINITIVTSTRNNGKTTSSWDLIINDIWKKYNYKYRVAIARTNDDKRKKSLGSFKSHYDRKIANEVGYHVVSESGIITYCEHNEEGLCIKESQKEIGRFISILQEENYKSAIGSFENYKFLFWDEFNEVIAGIHSKLWDRFVNIVSTIERFNRPFSILLLGNKVNANNDIFINFDLESDDGERDTFNDWFQDISINYGPPGDTFRFEGRYIDVGFNTFRNLQKKSLAAALASLSPSTDNMFNRGGFLEGQKYEVSNWKKFTNKKVICYYALKDIVLEYGTFFNDKVKKFKKRENWYFKELAKWEIQKNIPVYALSVEGYLQNEDAIELDKDDLVSNAEFWGGNVKRGQLFYSNFKVRDLLNDFIWMNFPLEE